MMAQYPSAGQGACGSLRRLAKEKTVCGWRLCSDRSRRFQSVAKALLLARHQRFQEALSLQRSRAARESVGRGKAVTTRVPDKMSAVPIRAILQTNASRRSAFVSTWPQVRLSLRRRFAKTGLLSKCDRQRGRLYAHAPIPGSYLIEISAGDTLPAAQAASASLRTLLPMHSRLR